MFHMRTVRSRAAIAAPSGKPRLWKRLRLGHALAPLCLAATLLAGCSVSYSPVTGQKRAYAYSWKQEIELGREHDREIVETFGLYADPRLTEYVERVGEAVLAQSHLRRAEADPELQSTQFTFRVLDSPVVNAFALPGGYVYVTRGLLAHLQNEAQLAVVLGHEIGHVAARHTSQRMLEANIGMLGVIGVSLLGEHLKGWGDETAAVGGLGLQMLVLGHSRGHERESDQLGVDYAADAGYRADEGGAFFAVLNRMKESEGWFPAFLSTHPDPGQRERAVVERARARMAAAGKVAENEFLAAVDGMVVGEDPRWGYALGAEFIHPEWGFRFPLPRGWRSSPDRQSTTLAPPDQPEVGVVLRRAGSATSARVAAESYMARTDSLRVLQHGPAYFRGLTGYTVEADRHAGADTTRLLLQFVEHEGKVFLFGGSVPAKQLSTYEPTFRSVLSSLAPIRDQRLRRPEPARLRVQSVDRDGPFRSLLPGELPRGITLEQLVLMNHLQSADSPVSAGSRVKMPVSGSP